MLELVLLLQATEEEGTRSWQLNCSATGKHAKWLVGLVWRRCPVPVTIRKQGLSSKLLAFEKQLEDPRGGSAGVGKVGCGVGAKYRTRVHVRLRTW